MLSGSNHMVDEKLIVPIVASGLVFLFIATAFVLFLLYFYQQRDRAQRERLSREMEYERQIADQRHEVQKDTLRTVGRELHDSIGQMLTVARIQIASRGKVNPSEELDTAHEMVLRSAQEVRELAHTLSNIGAKEFNLRAAMLADINRLNRMNEIQAKFEMDSGPVRLSSDLQFITYRIFQETLNNILKHAEASSVTVKVVESTDDFRMWIRDDGKGFDPAQANNGIGLRHMHERAALINAALHVRSDLGKGCTVELTIPLE